MRRRRARRLVPAPGAPSARRVYAHRHAMQPVHIAGACVALQISCQFGASRARVRMSTIPIFGKLIPIFGKLANPLFLLSLRVASLRNIAKLVPIFGNSASNVHGSAHLVSACFYWCYTSAPVFGTQFAYFIGVGGRDNHRPGDASAPRCTGHRSRRDRRGDVATSKPR